MSVNTIISCHFAYLLFVIFVDLPECDSQLANKCAENATCSVSQGEYLCECKTGFTGDGHNNCTSE